jgi:UDP-glucose 4-epimerase
VSGTCAWVVGRGGLLGRNVAAALAARDEQWSSAERVSWPDIEEAAAQLQLGLERFLDTAKASVTPWRLFWCAGSGTVASSEATLERETALVRNFAAVLCNRLTDQAAFAARGTIFFSSSAGGTYASSPDPPPFDEAARVGALAPYGRAKLEQEDAFARVAGATGIDVVVGRLSNLYGPGQNVAKPQGLIAHVGRATLRREPVSIYVPMDTIRDYLFAEDAGRMAVDVVAWREALRADGAPSTTTLKIIASEVDTTVAAVLGAWRQVLRRPLRVAHATTRTTRLQPRVLAFRSRIAPELRRPPTPLPVGIDAVRRDQLAQLMAGAG